MDTRKGYAIVPNTILEDQNITDKQLRLYIKISSLSAATGGCFASNQYFADLFNSSITTISRNINALSSKGYIQVRYNQMGENSIRRHITLTLDIDDIIKNDKCDYQKGQEPITKNGKYNNISLINNNSQKKTFSKKDYIDYCLANEGKIPTKIINIALNSGWNGTRTTSPIEFANKVRETFARYYDLTTVPLKELENVVKDIELWVISTGKTQKNPLSFLNNWLKNAKK